MTDTGVDLDCILGVGTSFWLISGFSFSLEMRYERFFFSAERYYIVIGGNIIPI